MFFSLIKRRKSNWDFAQLTGQYIPICLGVGVCTTSDVPLQMMRIGDVIRWHCDRYLFYRLETDFDDVNKNITEVTIWLAKGIFLGNHSSATWKVGRWSVLPIFSGQKIPSDFVMSHWRRCRWGSFFEHIKISRNIVRHSWSGGRVYTPRCTSSIV